MSSSPSDESLYKARLADDERANFSQARGDLNLADEIRLIRTVLAHLAQDIPSNHRDLGSALSVLLRAISLQAKGLGPSEIDQMIQRAAEEVRRELKEAKDRGELG